jgi:hypothetical protein
MRLVPLLNILALMSCLTSRASAQAPNRSAEPTTAARASSKATVGMSPTIQGNAFTSTNGNLANAPLRLRDARSGRVVAATVTDKSGLFTFRSIEPGSYVVELLGPDQAVLAASDILNVNAGDAVSAIVKLPFRAPPFAGVLGHTATSAAIVSAAAAASGVLATTVSGQPASPRR